jgi:glycosyltransferase involved in cell wall biosynthesis
VTVELLYAAFENREKFDIIPCVLAGSGYEMAPVGLPETLAYFAAKTGKPLPPNSPAAPVLPKALQSAPRLAPKAGDHVLFTGVVWTPRYIALFDRLTAQGVEFSAFVHDIIPVERPNLVPDETHRMFAAWLKTVVARARILFVSSRLIKDQILRWAVLAGVDVAARIVPVTLGGTEFGPLLSAQELKRDPAMANVSFDSFVLSVGTIDKRKNQTLLCKIWCRLISDLGAVRVPQLVLAGRDDLNIGKSDAAIANAIGKSQIVVLEGLSDQALASLYHACRFTVFPSLSEGYGSPVAESLGCGKLCLTSGLPAIKEHAKDLAWYFDPADEASAYDVIRRAIEKPDLRLAAERHIAQLYMRPSWSSTLQSMTEAIETVRTLA